MQCSHTRRFHLYQLPSGTTHQRSGSGASGLPFGEETGSHGSYDNALHSEWKLSIDDHISKSLYNQDDQNAKCIAKNIVCKSKVLFIEKYFELKSKKNRQLHTFYYNLHHSATRTSKHLHPCIPMFYAARYLFLVSPGQRMRQNQPTTLLSRVLLRAGQATEAIDLHCLRCSDLCWLVFALLSNHVTHCLLVNQNKRIENISTTCLFCGLTSKSTPNIVLTRVINEAFDDFLMFLNNC